MVNIQILNDLNAGVVNADQFSKYVCDIVGTEHYNDDLRELRGVFGYALVQSATNAAATTLPPVGTTARAFDTIIAPGGAADPNQGALRPLDNCYANFDGSEVDGEELWVLFGLGVEIKFPLQDLTSGAVGSASIDRLTRAVSLNQFSNSRGLEIGAVGDWPTVKGGGNLTSSTRNGYSDNGVRRFRPIALKPSTRFFVEGTVCSQPDVALFAELAENPLVDFVVCYRAWRMNIRETFGGAQCANLFR